jgi:hypothetical protein
VEIRRHAAAELEPVGTKDEDSEPWQPTVGDRVAAPGGREATITAIDERPDGTVCEVEYKHAPGQAAEPDRHTYRLSDLTPTREPSSAALKAVDRT